MRITDRERAAIKEIVQGVDRAARVYLFGSRVDDRLRGGDIDLLVLSEHVTLSEKLDVLSRVKGALGEQKIDLLVKTAAEAARDPFVADLLKTAVPL